SRSTDRRGLHANVSSCVGGPETFGKLSPELPIFSGWRSIQNAPRKMQGTHTEIDYYPRSSHCVAGAGGIEPPNGGIKIRCLTAWLRPNRRERAEQGTADSLNPRPSIETGAPFQQAFGARLRTLCDTLSMPWNGPRAGTRPRASQALRMAFPAVESARVSWEDGANSFSGSDAMTYRAPINDILLALNHGAGLKAAVEAGHYGDFDADIAEAVLEEAGKFATDVLAPLNRV